MQVLRHGRKEKRKERRKKRKERKEEKKINIFYLCSAHNTQQHRHKETRGIGERRENRTKGTDLESCEGNRMESKSNLDKEGSD